MGFVGYGKPSSPVWFLGMEEAGGGEDNLRRRLGFGVFEDLKEGHRKLGIFKHHERGREIQRTWRGMCVVMLRLAGQEVTPSQIRSYQAEQLGRESGATFLAELMPLPKPSVGDWGYESLLPQFSSREDYYNRIMPKRIQYLRAIIAKCSPLAVIAYGKGYWPNFRSLFPGARFESVSIFEVSGPRPLAVLCPHFTSRAMNGRFDELAELVRSALDASPLP
jgi:hypothetical protein